MTEECRPVRIFLLDDHEIVRRGLAEMLAAEPRFEVVGEAATAAEASRRIRALRPDVAVLDVQLPDGNGIDVCREVRSELPDTYCVIFTSYDDQDAVLACLLAGASGYLLKEIGRTDIVEAIDQISRGRSLINPHLMDRMIERVLQTPPVDPTIAALSEREREVLELITQGLTNRQIAERLFIGEQTVKNHVSRLLAKLGLQRRSQAAVYLTQTSDRSELGMTVS